MLGRVAEPHVPQLDAGAQAGGGCARRRRRVPDDLRDRRRSGRNVTRTSPIVATCHHDGGQGRLRRGQRRDEDDEVARGALAAGDLCGEYGERRGRDQPVASDSASRRSARAGPAVVPRPGPSASRGASGPAGTGRARTAGSPWRRACRAAAPRRTSAAARTGCCARASRRVAGRGGPARAASAPRTPSPGVPMTGDQENSTAANPPSVMADDPR